MHGTIFFTIILEVNTYKDGSLGFIANCVWKDDINANFSHGGDRYLHGIAKMVTDCKDYSIEIYWRIDNSNMSNQVLDYFRRRNVNKKKEQLRKSLINTSLMAMQ